MKTVQVYQYDAFTLEPNKGNPAGVVLNGDALTTDEMQAIAYEAGFNETAFLIASSTADFQIRYFTPQTEVDLCGHATIATVVAAKSKQLIKEDIDHIQIETKAGVQDITLKLKAGHWEVTMGQNPAQFKPFQGEVSQLLTAIGIRCEDLDAKLPIVYGNTGVWTLLVPVKSLAVCQKMQPHNQAFADILTEEPSASVHPFCLETSKIGRDMHGRHFSSTFAGTVEDAVTGTAAGVMGAYYATYIHPDQTAVHLNIEQGQEMNKDGNIGVAVKKAQGVCHVAISGHAVEAHRYTIVL